jgi:nicotinamidase-related amidase
MKTTSILAIICVCFCFPMTNIHGASGLQNESLEAAQTALLLIDIQDFYFPGGRSALSNPEEASLNAKKLLNVFREKNLLVVHIRHNAKAGAEIHKNVIPLDSEKVISKSSVNSFKETDLLDYLKQNEIKKLVICGMMTHMCVEAAVRAAADYGFEVTLVHDACATRALKFKNKEIPAEAVHFSTLASLSGYYAKVIDTATFLNNSDGQSH